MAARPKLNENAIEGVPTIDANGDHGPNRAVEQVTVAAPQSFSRFAKGRKVLIALLDAFSSKWTARRGAQRWRSRRVPRIKPRVVRVLQHDPEAFTQGLCYWSGHLYESTGLVGKSSVRCIDPVSGTVLQRALIENVWGEGIAVHGNRLVQLSYTDEIANIFSVPGLTRIGAYHYSGEGWGLATCGDTFLMTNGTDTIVYRDEAFVELKRLVVRIRNVSLRGLNDLVFAAGRIYANVYYDDSIYEIAAEDGQVSRIVDCSELSHLERQKNAHNILNGIAYAEDSDTFFVTGKHWRQIYEIAVNPPTC